MLLTRNPVECGGADPNFTKDGMPALHLAAGEGHADVCRTMLDAGVDRESRDGWGALAWEYAEEAGHADLVKLLKPRPKGTARPKRRSRG